MGEVRAGSLTSLAALVERLGAVKDRFTPLERGVKRRVLETLAARTIRSSGLLLRLHEVLCFMRAYPDDARLLRAVEEALAGFGKRVAALGAREAQRLEETGIAGTAIYCPLTHAVARWLVRRFPGSVELDRDDAESEDALGALLPLTIDTLAEEALVESDVPYRAWLAAAKGEDRQSDLAWVLDRLGRRGRSRKAARALYDRVQPRLRWDLGESPASRTLARISAGPVFFHRGALLPRGGPLGRRLPGLSVTVRRASRAEAIRLVDAALAAVTVRYREVYAFSFADPDDVVLAEIGRGVAVAWFGVPPPHRLPLRAHHGYLLLKNSVPIGYGDASLLFDWCEVAFNIFETFRQGESGFLFARLLGFLYQWLGVRAFHLSPYQLGHGNDEALASGAFWFYDKLGFRPVRPDLAQLADEERQRIARDPGYRTPRPTLERLGEGRMFLSVGRSDVAAVRGFEVQRLVMGAAAAPAAAAEVARWLGAFKWRGWGPNERIAFERLAPILGLIPDLPRWSAGERQRIVDIVRAKGRPREAEYLRRMQAHRRLRMSLLRLGSAVT